MGNTIGSIAGGTAVNFISQLIESKENGEKLPKFFDKLATLAIKGKGKAKDLAIEKAKDEAKAQTPWFIVAVLAIILIIVFIKMKK